MTVNILGAGTATSYLAIGRVFKLTRTNAVLDAELVGEEGRTLVTVTAISQLIRDLDGLL